MDSGKKLEIGDPRRKLKCPAKKRRRYVEIHVHGFSGMAMFYFNGDCLAHKIKIPHVYHTSRHDIVLASAMYPYIHS